MGIAKEYMWELQEERFEAWAAEHYPGVIADSDAWEQIRFYYFWEQQELADQAEQEYQESEAHRFTASLNNVHLRYRHAIGELRKLYSLHAAPQPQLVYSMSYVYAVTVMEAYLMYCARALLEHDWPLQRFREDYYLPFARAKNAEKQAALNMELSLFRPVARAYIVSRMTFHNVEKLDKYFALVLHVPPSWPLTGLEAIVQRRNDLVHRNGADDSDSPVGVSHSQLEGALQKIFDVIEAANISMSQEVDLFGNLRSEENQEIIATALNVRGPGGASL